MRRVSTVVVAVATALLLSIFVSAGPITGGGGLVKVTHGSAMTGSGTTGSPLDLRSCASGQVLVSSGSGSGWGCGSAVATVPANQIVPVSTGTGLGSSAIHDDGSSIFIAFANRFSIAEANGNTSIGGTLTGSGAVTLNGSGAPVMAWFGPAVSAPASAILKVNDNASVAVHNVPFSTDSTVDLAGYSIYVGRQVISTSGTYTPTTGTRKVLLRECGAGGGGGGAKGGASGGGAGGAYLEKWINPAATITGGTATIGAAGTAGAATPTSGGTGGDTSVVIQTVTYTAKGGLGSVSSSSSTESLGAAGQSGSTAGDFNQQGQPGTFGVVISAAGISGNGGSSPFGSGGVGVTSTTTPNPGTGACSGAGGVVDNSGVGTAGAVGTKGLIIIDEWR